MKNRSYSQKKSSSLCLCAGIFSLVVLMTTMAFAQNESCKAPSGFIDMNLAPSVFSARGGEGDEDEKGIGGTGLQPVGTGDGVGGTGSPYHSAYISGVVYAYGSICVNGLRVKYDAQTPVYLNGKKVDHSALTLGSTVKILSSVDGVSGTLSADRIDIERIVTGPVTAIDLESHTLSVMNETVLIDATDIPFSVGEIVSVSGLRRTDGQILSTSLTPALPGADESLVGSLKQETDGQWIVGRTLAELPNDEKAVSGQTVFVQGKWEGGRFIVSRLTALSPLPAINEKVRTYISYEGILETFHEDRSIVLSGLQATVKDLLCGGEPLEKGERIIAMGSLRPDGTVFFDGLVDVEPEETKILDNKSRAVSKPESKAAYND